MFMPIYAGVLVNNKNIMQEVRHG